MAPQELGSKLGIVPQEPSSGGRKKSKIDSQLYLYDLWQWLLCHLPSINLASLLIVFLPPGRGIRWHTDLYPQNGRGEYRKHVVGVSLLSDTFLWFRNRDGHQVSVFVPRRPMYLLYGPLRYEWQHSIRNCAPQESMGPRYALMFRDD